MATKAMTKKRTSKKAARSKDERTDPTDAVVMDGSVSQRLRARTGVGFRKMLLTMWAALLAIAVIMVSYVLAMFVAVRLVPNAISSVQQGTGITTEMPLELVLAAWAAPSGFLVLLLLVLTVTIIRWITAQAKRAHRAAREKLLPETQDTTEGEAR